MTDKNSIEWLFAILDELIDCDFSESEHPVEGATQVVDINHKNQFICVSCVSETVCRYNDGVNEYRKGSCPHFRNKFNYMSFPIFVYVIAKVNVAPNSQDTIPYVEQVALRSIDDLISYTNAYGKLYDSEEAAIADIKNMKLRGNNNE